MNYEDDIFGGSPKDKFFDIVFNANRNLVENELEKIFMELVALRELGEEKGINMQDINSFLALRQDELETGLNDVYIGLTGDILTQNE
ncbi:putative protein (DUF2018 domain) [Campylobacter iguaniorum]|uniref:DUF2018 domain protein n=1 Tax=Campylobacter iguaniorum TaxID=1244531 RepID=A0A076FBI2_9BACT|nr:DUF2018 family protein [Campylobacter iguaniorum]AII14792.1 hypothetical protein (DUF2018 domain) [Campylobacter iguaniorum]ALV24527.1 putative protein (DUF2018 domain) [Campylobacter iguaniorum]